MRILLFGATGMVGQGVLRACLLAPDVELVQTVGRSATGLHEAKQREVVHSDLLHYESIEDLLKGFDACFFTLGVSSAGMKEPEYTRITYDLTMAAATTLARLNPQMVFVYVSGAGTDSTEKGRSMWARVKGRTENDLLKLPFRAAYMFRPGFIEPVHGARSKTALYRAIYAMTKPLMPVLRVLMPNAILTTDQVGQAMLNAARRGAPKQVLEVSDLRALARR
jgi:uncharacterized protein YbjT (DUF2867 family)